MPEVVVATPDANGKARNWSDVFPIWKLNAENSEWPIINQILEAIAMNNRMGNKTIEELQAFIQESVNKNITELLAETETKLAALPNPKAGMFGPKAEDISDEHKAVLKDRNALWSEYGKWCFYIREVFANYATAYREYKK